MIVISTAFDPPPDAKAKCLASVAEQTISRTHDCPHIYVDASCQREPLSHFENLLAAVEGALPHYYVYPQSRAADDEIVICLDGDDWLATPTALARVQEEHDRGALLTYGSFRYADGRPGFAAYTDPATCRTDSWTATHLKSFRAGLLRRIDPEHLRYKGAWLEHARDLALMYPLLEMARERAVYIPDVLYVYNYANSTEFRGDAAMLAAERECVRYVRGLPKYERIPGRPL